MTPAKTPDRRSLRRFLFVLVGAASLLTRPMQGQEPCTANAIVCENQLTGNLSSEWDISGAGDSSIQ